MTVSTATSFNSYAGNGSTTSFAYAFKIFQDSNLVVTLVNDATGVETTQTLTTDYTVTGAGSDSGGNVVFGTAPASGNTVVIRRVLPVTQETNYVPNDPFPAEAHEDALDKLTMLVQQEVASSELAVQFPEGDVGSGINNILPSVTGRSDKLLKFGLDGGVEVIAASDLGNAIIGANYAVDTFTGTGSTTVYTLSAAPGSKANTAIYIDGVYQAKANYSVSGSTLTFTTAPPLNSAIEVVIGDAIPAGAATTASAVSYTQGGTGAVTTNVQAKLQDTVSVKDFGAVGDGSNDDTAAIQAAIDAAANGELVVGVKGETYRITSTLNFSGVRFDGNYCTIEKDFDGVGIDITGGALYTYLYNFNINASTAQTASDYDAAATSHGIKVNGTRVEAYSVGSSGHKGVGWWLECNGNMNKSKYLRIVGNTNSRAGVYMSGTQDDMSVWEFNGRFQSNQGYGMYITDTCTARDMVMWIYAEANQTGASFPAGEYAVYFGKLRNTNVWAYVEQQAGNVLELKADTNCAALRINSVRNNTDLILGSNIAYVQGNRFMDKDGNRAGTPLSVVGQLSRIAYDGEYVQQEFRGNGGVFGYVRGSGNASGEQTIGLYNSDASENININDTQLITTTPQFARMDDGRGIREIELERTVPTSNQVTLTVVFADTTSKYGSGMLEIFLCADTDATALDAIYLGHIPVSVRAGVSLMSTFTKIDTKATNITVNASYPTTSGTTMTVVFDCHANIIEVMGHVTMRGGEAYITSATLS